MINTTFLRTFVDLAETKHFTKTAQRLHMTQPGVSQHIKSLEEYYEAQLILREGRQFVITEAGHKILEYADEMFKSHENFRQSLHDDQPFSGIIKLSCPGSYGLKLQKLLIRYNKKHPELKIYFTFAPNQGIVQNVIKNEIDFGFSTQKIDEPLLDFQSFAEERLMLICPRGREKITLDQLKNWGMINHPDGSYHATRLLSSNFPDSFQTIEQIPISGFSNQISLIAEPVTSGLGFTVLPEGAVQNFKDREKLRIVKLSQIVTDTIYLVKRRDKQLAIRFEELLKQLRD